jgi:hypothetical protein
MSLVIENLFQWFRWYYDSLHYLVFSQTENRQTIQHFATRKWQSNVKNIYFNLIFFFIFIDANFGNGIEVKSPSGFYAISAERMECQI